MGVQNARKVFSLTSTGPGMCSLTCPIKCVNSLTGTGSKARDFGIPPDGSAKSREFEFPPLPDVKPPGRRRAWVKAPASLGFELDVHIHLHRHGLLLPSHVHRHRGVGVNFTSACCRQEFGQVESALAAALAGHFSEVQLYSRHR